MTKNTYKIIDVAMLTGIAIITEALSLLFLKNVFPGELFILSVAVTMSIIVSMRWKWTGVIPAIAGGLTLCVIEDASAAQYLVYAGGNAFIALLPLWFLWKDQKQTAESAGLSFCYALAGYLVVILGRTIMSLFFDAGFSYFADFLASDLINIVFGLGIIFITRRQNGIFESQELYLKRIASEKKEDEIYG